MKNKGQALVEYILIIFVILFITFGINKLFLTAFKNYFNKILNFRSGIQGMFP